MLGSLTGVALGVAILVYRHRLIRAIVGSQHAVGKELGGPATWMGNPPHNSRRDRVSRAFAVFTVLIVGLGFVIVGTLGVIARL